MSDTTFTVLHPGAVFHGRYRVVRCIKAGGMGAVYEVVDINTESRRALKVMLPSTIEDPDLRSRFELEAKITGNLESDHVVKVSDAGIDAATDVPFLVMELLRGQELSAILKRKKRLEPETALALLAQAALALDKTHAAGIVHRDLKPENLFVTRRDDGSACVKVLDFGIAKVVAQATTSGATRALGTPIFMAPEQIRGHGHIGPRADIYTLGQITYAMLVGETYWIEEKRATDSLYALFSVVLAGMKEPASERAMRRAGVALPLGFDAWFRKATALRPEDRFERATEAIAVLKQVFDIGAPRADADDLVQIAETTGDTGVSARLAAERASRHSSPDVPITPSASFEPRADFVAPAAPLIVQPITGATRDAMVSESLIDPGRRQSRRLYAYAGGGALVALLVGLVLFGPRGSSSPSTGRGEGSATQAVTGVAPTIAATMTAPAAPSEPQNQAPSSSESPAPTSTEVATTPSSAPTTDASAARPAKPTKVTTRPPAAPAPTSTLRKHEGMF